MSKIKLKRASLEDLHVVCRLENLLFCDPYSNEQIERDLKNKDQIFLFLAYCGENLIGYAYFSILFDEAELFRIAVLSQYRGLGYGEQILRNSIKTIGLKVKKIFLEVSVNNFSAINLYQKLNFKNINTRKNYYFDGSDAYVMQLLL